MNKFNGLKNSYIYVENKGIIKTNIIVENGLIKSFEKNDNSKELKDGLILIPGFIDEHTHGANHSDSMNGDFKSLDNISKSILQEGTTSFLFTTMTMKKDIILNALKGIKEYIENKKYYSIPLGIHLEGPFISEEFKGAQNKEDILPLDTNILQEFIEVSNHHIKEITFSYKKDKLDFLNAILKEGIVPSLGHTNDTFEEANDGIKHGIKVGTHTYNAMKGIHHRDIGTVGALMLNDNVSCELICDLHHVCKEAIELLYRLKGKDNIILITDSMEAKYLENGTYSLGGNAVYVKNGVATLKDGTLAGSVLKMNEAVRNIKNCLNISLETAIDMASKNPALNLNVYDKIGSIKENKQANFVVIDKDLNVYATIVNGILLYQKEEIFK